MNNKTEAKNLTHIYFVRHAEPQCDWEADDTRPLTGRGMRGAEAVTNFFRSIPIDAVYSSPYKRSYQTVFGTALTHNLEIKTDDRFHERVCGVAGNAGANQFNLFERRWQDRDWCEAGSGTWLRLMKCSMLSVERRLS